MTCRTTAKEKSRRTAAELMRLFNLAAVLRNQGRRFFAQNPTMTQVMQIYTAATGGYRRAQQRLST